MNGAHDATILMEWEGSMSGSWRKGIEYRDAQEDETKEQDLTKPQEIERKDLKNKLCAFYELNKRIWRNTLRRPEEKLSEIRKPGPEKK